jgi:hypothetical protein
MLDLVSGAYLLVVLIPRHLRYVVLYIIEVGINPTNLKGACV